MTKKTKEISDIFNKVHEALEGIAEVNKINDIYFAVIKNDYQVLIPYRLFKYDSIKLIENKIKKLYEY